jgi:hypothetical protein
MAKRKTRREKKRRVDKRAQKRKPENKRLIVYIAVLIFAVIFWLLLTIYVSFETPAGKMGSVSEVLLWKQETSFDNKDIEYVNSILPDLCNSLGEEQCSNLCSPAIANSECTIENVYINNYQNPETGENAFRLYATIKGNTICRCYYLGLYKS